MTDSAVGRTIYPELRRALPSQLPRYLARQRWFGGKARTIRSAELADIVPIPTARGETLLLVVSITYSEGANESYAVPVLGRAASAGTMEDASLKVEGTQGDAIELVDAITNEAFLTALLELIERQATLKGENGELRATQTTAFARLDLPPSGALRPKPTGAEQSNSSIIYGDRVILKFFRRVEEGINPDLEIGLFLTEKAQFRHTPHVAGSLQYHFRDGKQSAQGILQTFVPNQGDAWSYTLTCLADFYGALAKDTAQSDVPQEERTREQYTRDSAAAYLNSGALLGRRTAQMHLALASDWRDRVFAPEPFTMEFQHALEQSMLALTSRVFRQMREKLAGLPAEWRLKAERVAAKEAEIIRRFQSALARPIRATRARIHGDYHLGQVLFTGSDFVIIDFEGEPARPLAERRIKRSPLQDVAGMLRSFHYAAFAPLLTAMNGQAARASDLERFGAWAESWNSAVAERFLESYFETAGAAAYLPESREEAEVLLELHLLEKAVYELGYELNNRPSWLGIPLQGISRLLSS
jgi:maltose alpha-D-glucosyltransferase/alpha-amylase